MAKVWLITGSSRGFGRALANAVLEHGDRVVATSRRVEDLQDLKHRYGAQVEAIPLDVRDPVAASEAVAFAMRRFGRLDVLVNNAGYGTIRSAEDTSLEEFRAQIETNLFGTIFTVKASLPIMRQQGSGHIIQFSSVGGRIGALGRTAYSAAKWGVEGFSEALAKEVGPLGINITIVEPGGFRTDFASDQVNDGDIRREYASTVGAAARFQASYHGKQPGDPKRAAKVLIEIVEMSVPPLRLPLGSDAAKAIEEADVSRIEADRQWRSWTLSTDFPILAESQPGNS